MSTTQAAFLKRQRSYLKTEYTMLGNMLSATSKADRKHWDLIQQQESLKKEMNRITHQLKHAG